MSPTEQAASGPFTSAILSSMAELFIHDYEVLFVPAYEDAVRIRGRRPNEPADEIRNAFDHFSLATKRAFVVDGREVPLRVGEQPVPDSTVDALRNLDQAHRHLSIGRFYCFVHQIMGLISRIGLQIASLSNLPRETRDGYQLRADSLENRFLDDLELNVAPMYDREQIRIEIENLETKILNITNLTNQFALLAQEILDLQ